LQRCRGRQKQKRKRLRKLSERPERWTLVAAAREGSLDDQLFEFITERTARSDAGAAVHQHVPDDPAGLASTKHELDLSAARAVFDGLTTRTLADRTPGRYPAAIIPSTDRGVSAATQPGCPCNSTFRLLAPGDPATGLSWTQWDLVRPKATAREAGVGFEPT
jgi:hypothetical protein